MPNATVLMIRALGKRYRAGVAGCWAEARTLVNIDLDIVEGEVVALVGRASAGKTTLLRCAARLLVPDEGFVDFGRRADGRERVVRYFADGVQAARAARRGETWDLALIDDVDHVQGDVAAAFALVHVLTHAKGEGTALLLAARQPIVVGELSDRTIRLEHGCIIDQAGSARPAIARVAEHGVPLTVIPGTPSIR